MSIESLNEKVEAVKLLVKELNDASDGYLEFDEEGQLLEAEFHNEIVKGSIILQNHNGKYYICKALDFEEDEYIIIKHTTEGSPWDIETINL